MTPPFIADYHRAFDTTWTGAAPAGEVRFVVLDSETTGLDARKDRLITIGAIAVRGGDLRLDDTFDALIEMRHNTASVTVHGITRQQSEAGVGEPEALERFLAYLADGVIVGHHIGHDIATLDAAYGRHWGFRLRNRSLDTMELALHLERDGAFARTATTDFSLDGLCARFGVIPHDRHTAAGDAFMTALVFQRLLRLAERHGRGTLGGLLEPWVAEQ